MSENKLIERLQKLLITKDYEIDHVEFNRIIKQLVKEEKLAPLKNSIEHFIRNVSDNFFDTHLANLVLSIYEKYLNEQSALEIAIKIIRVSQKKSKKQTALALSSIFRFCRRRDDYSQIDKLFKEQPDLLKIQKFAILYELTFYYNWKNDIETIEQIIVRIIRQYKDSAPIIKTARSLCVRYGLYEKYQHLLKLPYAARNEKNLITEIEEAEYEKVFRSAALADLTNGIAHEFGQPVTNIRFAIQYYQRIFEKETIIDKEQVIEIFKDILTQTERIGQLIERLAPVTTTKSTMSKFDLKDCIERVFEQEKLKLKSSEIEYEIKTINDDTLIEFDYTQLKQVFSNLLNNSIDSVNDIKISNEKAKIWVTIKKFNKKYSIWFADNGKGISEIDIDRIFNPFYTTKPPDKGQGLGLYIVSNLLKMNGGSISVDRRFKRGAKFIILIPQNRQI